METDSKEYRMSLSKGFITVAVIFLISFGIYESFWGWEQLLGFKSSKHSMFRITGSFYNPGPFCSFLAMIVPLALFYVLNCKKKFLYWIGLSYIVIAVPLMPILMARTGWIAAFVGSIIVLKSKGLIKFKFRKNIILLIAFILISILVALFFLKPTSALGRVFLWQIGFNALWIHPLSGVGWNNVSGALGSAQEAYFNSNHNSIYEFVADSPEYAFNEYLQIGIAFGIPAMAAFVGLLIALAVYSYRMKMYGIAGSITAFSVVCFSSYPLQFVEFVTSFSILILIIISGCDKLCSWCKLTIFTIASFISVIITNNISERNRLTTEWNYLRYAFQTKLNEKAIRSLDSLENIYGFSPKFLFDYGKALRQTELYEESNRKLLKGLEQSSDPMFLNLIGRNYQDLKQFEIAENYYQRAATRLPGRMYPYYLLAKLYADSLYYNPEKFYFIYLKSSEMKPKVMSPAIKQIQSELKNLNDSIISIESTK